jgi:Xaa-Pro aminopeptidase
MRQSFEETTDPGFGPRHVPLIREQLARQGLDGVLIPHEDEHGNEYLPAANDRLAWSTGFTGSAGAAVVTTDAAAVFIDGRYTLQVRDQVDAALFEIRDLVDGGVPAWLCERGRPGQVIGYDPRLHSPDALAQLRAAAAGARVELRPVADNPVDLAWADAQDGARPAQPQAPVHPYAADFSGEDSAAKRARVGEALAAAGAEAAVITAPSSVAWLFNVRGGDVIRSPLPLSQAVLHADGTAELFLDPAKATPDLHAWLGNQVSLRTPDEVPAAIAELGGRCVLVDPALSSAWWFDQLEGAGATVVRAQDPVALPRARKNAVEVEGARRAHRRDAAAVARFLYWLATEGQLSPPDELETVSKLEAFREATGSLKDLSFDTIAGAGPNAALPHYRPTHRTNRRTAPGELLLVDSGAQYEDGTTDITRTVAIGRPTAEMRRRFTLVLKGHIALSRVRFPEGVSGHQLDALARTALWSDGLDYDHGTGHGVGSYLGVHEGPQRIAKWVNTVALEPGMIVSNEPGFYKTGAYGIRIENLQVVTPPTDVPGGERPMLGFETLTLAPIDRTLIDAALLDAPERAWLDAYHARVLAEVGPLLEPAIRSWLQEVTAPSSS